MKLHLILFLLIAHSFAFTQDLSALNIKMGEEFSRDRWADPIGMIDNSVFSMNQTDGVLKEGTQIWERTIDGELLNKTKLKLDGELVVSRKAFGFSNKLFFQLIGPDENGKVSEKIATIHAFNKDGSLSASLGSCKTTLANPYADTYLSKNGENLLILSARNNYHSGIIFDKDLNVVQEIESFQIPTNQLSIVNTYFTDSQKLMILGYKSYGAGEIKKRDYIVIEYDFNSQKANVTDVSVDVQIHSAAMQLVENDRIVVAGLYSGEDLETVKGTFMWSLDKEVQSSKEEAFPNDFVVQRLREKYLLFEKSKDSEKKNPIIPIEVLDIVVKDNNEIVLVFQPSSSVSCTSRDTFFEPTQYSREFIHFVGDIYLVNFSQAGDVKWKLVVDGENREQNMNIRSPFVTKIFENENQLLVLDSQSLPCLIDNQGKLISDTPEILPLGVNWDLLDDPILLGNGDLLLRLEKFIIKRSRSGKTTTHKTPRDSKPNTKYVIVHS